MRPPGIIAIALAVGLTLLPASPATADSPAQVCMATGDEGSDFGDCVRSNASDQSGAQSFCGSWEDRLRESGLEPYPATLVIAFESIALVFIVNSHAECVSTITRNPGYIALGLSQG
jgi:hypothetical protein